MKMESGVTTMTDNEIIKALECCKSSNDLTACWKCPALKLKDNICGDCSTKISNGIMDATLDLINRQNAEIDRLKNELHGKVDYIHEQREVIDDLKDKYNKKGLTLNIAVDKEQIEKSVQECMRDYELQINGIRNGEINEFAEELIFNLEEDIGAYANAGHTLNVYQWLYSYLRSKGAIKEEDENVQS